MWQKNRSERKNLVGVQKNSELKLYYYFSTELKKRDTNIARIGQFSKKVTKILPKLGEKMQTGAKKNKKKLCSPQ